MPPVADLSSTPMPEFRLTTAKLLMETGLAEEAAPVLRVSIVFLRCFFMVGSLFAVILWLSICSQSCSLCLTVPFFLLNSDLQVLTWTLTWTLTCTLAWILTLIFSLFMLMSSDAFDGRRHSLRGTVWLRLNFHCISAPKDLLITCLPLIWMLSYCAPSFRCGTCWVCVGNNWMTPTPPRKPLRKQPRWVGILTGQVMLWINYAENDMLRMICWKWYAENDMLRMICWRHLW